MCIRDRNLIVYKDKLFFVALDEDDGRQLRSYDDAAAEFVVYPKSGNVTIDAVSYTHLTLPTSDLV